MAPDFSLRMAELIASRLCHDLVTPVGAIATGLELFQEGLTNSQADSREIVDLIQHSAQTASARLSFFRIAFGSNGERISLGEVRTLVENYFLRSKMEFHWTPPFQQDQGLQKWGRVLLNGILWMSECAPKGGHLHISSMEQGAPPFSLRLVADSIILHQGTVEILEGKASLDEVTPRTIPCYLIRRLTDSLGGTVYLRKSELPSELSLEIKGE